MRKATRGHVRTLRSSARQTEAGKRVRKTTRTLGRTKPRTARNYPNHSPGDMRCLMLIVLACVGSLACGAHCRGSCAASAVR